MATTKRRLNITLSPEIEKAISGIAKREKIPQSAKAVQLIKLALEIEEDFYFGKIGEWRMKEKVKFISHADAWR